VHMSVRRLNSAQRFFTGYSNHRGSLRKIVSAGERAGVFAWSWAGSGWIQPSTIHPFPFSFFCQAWKFIGNPRKIVKL
jgi:hypothetical protein